MKVAASTSSDMQQRHVTHLYRSRSKTQTQQLCSNRTSLRAFLAGTTTRTNLTRDEKSRRPSYVLFMSWINEILGIQIDPEKCVRWTKRNPCHVLIIGCIPYQWVVEFVWLDIMWGRHSTVRGKAYAWLCRRCAWLFQARTLLISI